MFDDVQSRLKDFHGMIDCRKETYRHENLCPDTLGCLVQLSNTVVEIHAMMLGETTTHFTLWQELISNHTKKFPHSG